MAGLHRGDDAMVEGAHVGQNGRLGRAGRQGDEAVQELVLSPGHGRVHVPDRADARQAQGA